MSSISKRRKEGSKGNIKSVGDHQEFLKRISKTLYYGQLPTLTCLSLPVTEISCEVWSMAQRGHSVRRLHADQAASIAHSACVSPCALVLAILYLERLKLCNPDYLTATSPADLFLVSLMVSNKFLQDDGEDDEVICSEWAASGGLDLHQLNKLEADFLNAIEWNLYINEKTFEIGLLWLERQVAMKQALMRGFFTYTDLSVTCNKTLMNELMKSVCCACFTLTLSYLSSFLTLVTSTLVVSNVWLPSLEVVATRGSIATDISSHSISTSDMYLQPQLFNTTLAQIAEIIVEENVDSQFIKCCVNWQKYHDKNENKKNWYWGVVAYDFKSFQTWWSKTSILNWLYQSSLINPIQRWLEKINKYADFIKDNLDSERKSKKQCKDTFMKVSDKGYCFQKRLNYSKLNIFTTSMSDR
ncbi:protein CNPPD1 isoform X1 [Pieris brassicae]|uniref:protein CNPPD1 isoform X1 n=2 Tax=Pieris brassicae TaxID=7116 RepID=UPI001E660A58|nr:protein CNPPD1 isoform X1 [Pieris brassicae]